MEFTFEIESSAGYYRWQKDNSWRKKDQPDIKENDFVSSDICDLISKQEKNKSVTLNGKSFKINPDHSDFGDQKEAYYQILAHRRRKPLLPSLEQLISTIKQGDDRINNSLILNVYGFYELREFSTLNFSYKDPTIVFRYETFIAGNDYVGSDVIKDEKLMRQLYKNSLSFWLAHLKNGRTNMYYEIDVSESLDSILSKIDNLEM